VDGIVCRPLGIPSASLIELTGALHGAVSLELSRLVRHMAHRGLRWIVFDLRAGVTLDSRAIGALLLAQTLCERRHGRVVLLSPPPAVTTLLEAMGIASHFTVSDDYHGLLAEIRRHTAVGNDET